MTQTTSDPGPSSAADRWPVELRYRRGARVLSVTFDDGTHHELSAELLRVESPSAEVQGHGLEERKLVAGKRHVGIETIEPVGHYAVRLVFDDGHDTGFYTWATLDRLGRERDILWADYEARLHKAGLDRE